MSHPAYLPPHHIRRAAGTPKSTDRRCRYCGPAQPTCSAAALAAVTLPGEEVFVAPDWATPEVQAAAAPGPSRGLAHRGAGDLDVLACRPGES